MKSKEKATKSNENPTTSYKKKQKASKKQQKATICFTCRCLLLLFLCFSYGFGFVYKIYLAFLTFFGKVNKITQKPFNLNSLKLVILINLEARWVYQTLWRHGRNLCVKFSPLETPWGPSYDHLCVACRSSFF